ncbi:MAG: glycosyltransferase [Candidatus Hodarchaeota archaeon]
MNEPYQSRTPELSVVVAVVSDARHLERCLTALSQQVAAPAIEIIVPYDYRDDDILLLESRFPKVQFYRVNSLPGPMRQCHEHLDKIRAIGLRVSRGEIIALLEDHDRPDKYWAMHVMEAHKGPYAAVGGAVENEIDRLVNWAVYFCDFSRYQNPVKSGPSRYLTDVNISYKRQALNSIREVWYEYYHEPFVNGTLTSQGKTLWLSPNIVVYQHRRNLTLGLVLRERYIWGRYYAGNRVQNVTLSKRLLYLILSPLLPVLLMTRKIRDVLIRKRLINVFIKAFALILLLTLFWSCGEFVGYVTGRATAKLDKMNG